MGELAALITAVAALLGAVAGIVGLVLQRRTGKAVALLSVEKKNEVQDKKIARIEAELAALGAAILRVNKYFEKEDFIEELKRSIRDRANTFAEHNKDVPKPFVSLVFDGTNHAAWFFSDAWRDGWFDSPETLSERAISVLRGLRSGTGNNVNLPDEYKDNLKIRVAYPLVRRLAMSLRNSPHPVTPSDYQKVVLAFIDDFINESRDLLKLIN